MRKIIFACFFILLFLFVSCDDEPNHPVVEEVVQNSETKVEKPVEELVQTPDVPPEPEIDPTKTEISYLTGLPCTPDEKNNRPIAVMLNNNKVSYPQESISFADIIYECDMEGGVTRLMAIYSDWSSLGNIGSMRSARNYFVDIANAHDAIYVHAGGSPSAYETLYDTEIDRIDGVNMYNIPDGTFWRDKNRIKECGYEHSMLTSGSKILEAANHLKYRTSYKYSFNSTYSFKKEFSQISESPAEKITLVHSNYISVDFIYDFKENKYFKRSFGAQHVDGSNEVQLSFENVLVLFVGEKVLDDEGRLDLDLIGEGKGYYLSGGYKTDVTWEREKEGTLFSLYDENGALILNPGKTHITLFNKNRKDYVIIN